MQEFKYSDVHGYGTVYTHSICIYLSGDSPYEHVNPLALLSPFGTFHFGIHTVHFTMD